MSVKTQYTGNEGRVLATGVELNRLATEFFALAWWRGRAKDRPDRYQTRFDELLGEVRELMDELSYGAVAWEDDEG